MRMFVVALGIVMLLMGSVWAFQGAGYIPGSFMTNDPTWIWIGAPVALGGLIVTFIGLRMNRAAKTPP